MPEIRVSALSAATAPDGTEIAPVVQGGVTKKMPVGAANGLATLGADGKLKPAQSGTIAGITNVERLATGGTGTQANPWTGWESAVNALPDGSLIRLGFGYFTQTVAITVKYGWTIEGLATWASVINNTGTTDSFIVAGGVNGIGHVRFKNFQLSNAATAGHLFNITGAGGVGGAIWENLLLIQANGTKSIQYADQSTLLDCLMTKCFLRRDMGASTPAIYLRAGTTSGSAINTNTWTRCRFDSQGTGAYFVHIEYTANDSFADDNVFRDINFENPVGGCIKALSTQNLTVENCNAYDLTTSTADLFYLGKSATSTSLNVRSRFKGVQRHGGALGAGLKDIKLVTGEAGESTFEQCTGTIDNGSTPANVYTKCSTPENIGTSRIVAGVGPIQKRRTAGTVAVVSTTWVDVDTALDVQLAADAGEWVFVSLDAFAENQASFLYIDAVSWVSGAAVNSWGGNAVAAASTGVSGWTCVNSQWAPIGSVVARQVTAADLVTGQLTIRLRARVNVATSHNLRAGADNALTVTVWKP